MPTLYSKMFSRELQIEKVNTIPQIFTNTTPSLSYFAAKQGKDKVVAMLALLIIDLDEYLNFNKRMSNAAIEQSAEFIYNTYFQITMTDVLFVFKQAKIGKYGAIFTLNGQIILSWFDQHFTDRCQAAAVESEKEHHNQVYDQYTRIRSTHKISEIKQEIRQAVKRHNSEKK